MSKIKFTLVGLSIFFLINCSGSKLLTKNEEAKPSTPTLGITNLFFNKDETKTNALNPTNNKPLFYKDGQQAYYLKCDGPSWSECIELAGIACKNKGYDVLEKNTVKIPSLIASDKIQNEMYIACKIIDEVPKK